MQHNDSPFHFLTGEGMERASVFSVQQDGTLMLLLKNGDQCPGELLHTSPIPLTLKAGDEVLAWIPQRQIQANKALVLGKIISAQDPATKTTVLEARENLVLKCGKASITLGKNGKILIKGLKISSHAKESNKIKGGSISIN
jgi:hypothetical protein